VFDVGEVDDCSYLAFEYVEADTLAQRLRKGPLPDIEARACVAAIISALEFARDMGAVVANLTPGSVLLAEPLKLFLDPAGAIVTHPEFAAPEAASGDVTDVTSAADVYRVGALLYAMLTTKSPQLEVAQKRSQDAFADYTPVSPRQLNPAVSEKLEAICLKCLAPAPIDRYGSLREVAEALA
jgi:serine/threonine protein kinase